MSGEEANLGAITDLSEEAPLREKVDAVTNESRTRRPVYKVSSGSSAHRQRARKWIVRLVMTVFWLLIFEGALRKWAFPGLHKYLFFIRDPFVVATYVLAFKYDLWPKNSLLLKSGLWLGGAFLALSLLQSMIMQGSPVIAVYGWRNYFFYLPLAFLIGANFSGKDLRALVKWSLIVCVPIALLCYRQFEAPPTDTINQAIGTNSFMLAARGVVRTSGTFTVSTAQTAYIGSLLAMLFACWLMPLQQRPLKRIPLFLSSAAVLTMFAVSGARSVFFMVALVTLAGLIASHLTNKRINLPNLSKLPLLLAIGAGAYICLFPNAVQVMVERQLTAQVNEGNLILRAFGSFVGVFKVLPHLTLIGSGMGSLTNAASVVLTGRLGATFIAEDEWSRIMMECGIFGFLYIAYRVVVAYAIARDGIAATRRSHNPLPLLLVGYELLTLLIGQMTLQGTINGFGWLFLGFCLAANRLHTRKDCKAGDIWA